MKDSLHLVCPNCDVINRIPAGRVNASPKCGQCHLPLFAGTPREVKAASLRKHIERDDIPVLVDFWAPWCGPCKMMAPAYQRAALQLEPGMRLLKVNTEVEQQAGAHFNIRSIPTLVLFHQGSEVARQAGAMSAPDIERWVNSEIGA